MNQTRLLVNLIPLDLKMPLLHFDAGGDFVVDSEFGGSWFTLAGDAQAQAGDDLKVLLAQLTVTNDAVITGNFGLQLFVNGSQSNVEDYDNILFSSPEAPIYGCMDPGTVNYTIQMRLNREERAFILAR